MYWHENPHPYSWSTIANSASPTPLGYQFGSGFDIHAGSAPSGPWNWRGIDDNCWLLSCWQRFATQTRSASAAPPGIHDDVEDSPFSAHQDGMIVLNSEMLVPSSGATSLLTTSPPGRPGARGRARK